MRHLITDYELEEVDEKKKISFIALKNSNRTTGTIRLLTDYNMPSGKDDNNSSKFIDQTTTSSQTCLLQQLFVIIMFDSL